MAVGEPEPELETTDPAASPVGLIIAAALILMAAGGVVVALALAGTDGAQAPGSPAHLTRFEYLDLDRLAQAQAQVASAPVGVGDRAFAIAAVRALQRRSAHADSIHDLRGVAAGTLLDGEYRVAVPPYAKAMMAAMIGGRASPARARSLLLTATGGADQQAVLLSINAAILRGNANGRRRIEAEMQGASATPAQRAQVSQTSNITDAVLAHAGVTRASLNLSLAAFQTDWRHAPVLTVLSIER